jgi:hypothetical protein
VHGGGGIILAVYRSTFSCSPRNVPRRIRSDAHRVEDGQGDRSRCRVQRTEKPTRAWFPAGTLVKGDDVLMGTDYRNFTRSGAEVITGVGPVIVAAMLLVGVAGFLYWGWSSQSASGPDLADSLRLRDRRTVLRTEAAPPSLSANEVAARSLDARPIPPLEHAFWKFPRRPASPSLREDRHSGGALPGEDLIVVGSELERTRPRLRSHVKGTGVTLWPQVARVCGRARFSLDRPSATGLRCRRPGD